MHPRMGLTHEMDLRTGTPVWQAFRVRGVATTALPRNLETDVLVVGAGISGAIVADLLSERGLSVAIVDRRGPLRGSTAASTALLQYEIDTPLRHLAKRIGRARAERIWRRSRLALDALRERARHLDINADCINRDSLYLEGDLLDEEGLRDECAARRDAGFEVSFLSRAEVRRRYGIRARAALLGYDNLAADPRRLAAGFLRAAHRRGARIHAPEEVVALDASTTGVVAETARGASIRARHVVLTTGYELAKGVPRRHHAVASTWALATRPHPRAPWPTECFVWEASEPYLYLRTTPDRRVVCGGEDEALADEAKRDALLPAKIEAIREKLSRLMPKLDTAPEYAWSGCFGTSDTGTPSIGPVPGMPSCFAVLGYGGNGITFSMMAAQMITNTIDGRGDPDADLVSFRRTF